MWELGAIASQYRDISLEGAEANPLTASIRLVSQVDASQPWAPTASGLSGGREGSARIFRKVDHGCGHAVAPAAATGTAAMTSAERIVPPSSSGRSSATNERGLIQRRTGPGEGGAS